MEENYGERDSNSQTDHQLPEFLLEFCRQIDLSENQVKECFQLFSSTYEETVLASGYVTPMFCGKAFDAAVKNKQADDSAKAMRILDIGAGTGLLGAILKELGYINVDAIDCCEAMLQKAKEKNVYQKSIVKFVHEKKNEEIKDGEYDAMVSAGAITAPQIQARAFDEMLRWLKKGGLFCFTVRRQEFEKESLGYKKKFQQLEEEKKWKIIDKELVDYFDKENVRDSGARKAYVCIYQKL